MVCFFICSGYVNGQVLSTIQCEEIKDRSELIFNDWVQSIDFVKNLGINDEFPKGGLDNIFVDGTKHCIQVKNNGGIEDVKPMDFIQKIKINRYNNKILDSSFNVSLNQFDFRTLYETKEGEIRQVCYFAYSVNYSPENKIEYQGYVFMNVAIDEKENISVRISGILPDEKASDSKKIINCGEDKIIASSSTNKAGVVQPKSNSSTQIKALKEISTQKLQVKFRSFLERIAAQNLETSQREKIFQDLSKDVFLNQNISLFDENDNESMTLEGYFSDKFVKIYCPNNAVLRITGTLPSVFSEDISFKETNFPVTAEVVWHFTFDVFNPTLGGRANEKYSLKLNLKYLENNDVAITSIRVLKSIDSEDLSKLVGELLIVFDKLQYEWENEHKVLTADVAELNDLLQKLKLNLSPDLLKENPKLVASIENITKFLGEITKKPEEEKEEDLFEERRNFLASKGWITLKDVQIKFENLGTANIITETEKQEVNQVYRKLISNLQAIKNATNELNFSEMQILNELINELETELKIINR